MRLACTMTALFLLVSTRFCLAQSTLVSHYPFDNDALNEANDFAHGTLMGDATFADDAKFGSASLQLFGNGDHVDVTQDAFPNDLFGFDSGSVTFWVKLADGAPAENIQFMGNLNANDSMAILTGTNGVGGLQVFPRAANGNQLRVRDGGDGDVFNPNLTWADGDWHHLAYTWAFDENGSHSVGLYIDGDALDLSTASNTLTSADPLTPWEFGMAIGGRNNRGVVDMSLTGQIDDFRVYAGVLTDDEVLDLALESETIFPADVDFNGIVNAEDADLLVAAILENGELRQYDLNADGKLDTADLERFLADAAAFNGFAQPYEVGDADLNGQINASDLNALGSNWQGRPNRWSGGDFDANGIVDANDLNFVGLRWQSEIPLAAAVPIPEPSMVKLLALCLVVCLRLPLRHAM